MDRIGAYELLEEIGAGGFGRVYRARHVDLEVIRAVKVATDSEFVRQLRREGRVLARLQHPRTVLVHDMSTAHEPPYIVMEYVEGEDLSRRLERGPLPVEDTVQIMLDVLEALEHAHGEGVIHRDVKPSNILLDREGRAKVSDFGLGRVVEQASKSWGRVQSLRSGSGEISGTLKYMSPEQLDPSLLKGEELDGRSDLYSVGLVLYEMLTGEFPAGISVPMPSERDGELPSALDEVFRRCVAGDRERRYETAEEVAGELGAILEQVQEERQRREEEERKRAEEARRREEEEAKRRERVREQTAEAERLHEVGEYEQAKARWEEVIAAGGDEEAARAGIAEAEAALRALELERRAGEERKRREREAEQRRQRVAEAAEQGRTATKAGRYEEVIGAWERVLEVEPEHAEARRGIDEARRLLEQQQRRQEQQRQTRLRRRLWSFRLLIPLAAVVVPLMIWRMVVPARAPQASVRSPENAEKGQTWVSPADGKEMVYVPAGEFLMGSPSGEGDDDEHPQRRVYLDAFWIDKCEVTVGEYRRFCEAKGRGMPEAPSWGWKEDHPIVNVSWHDAAAYAEWAGKRLPTEAEWEKAARGGDGRKYPWGNGEPGSNRCNLSGSGDGYKYTAPVGSFREGASPYGCLDMAGNVWEWCADWYDGDYYEEAPSRNPKGPSSGNNRVVRGGSWYYDSRLVRCASRFYGHPSYRYFSYGFRCARDS